MRRLLLLAACSAASFAWASEPSLDQVTKSGDKSEKFKLIHVADVVASQKKGDKVYLFDANSPETRTKMGIVPGAVQLSMAHNYDLKVLPADKKSKLVFYCANVH